jgi:hypothetical protein
MPDRPTALAIHGIWNLRPGRTPDEAARDLAAAWRPRLAAGYVDAGLAHATPPDLVTAYYAHLLGEVAQSEPSPATLTADQQTAMWNWLSQLGLPQDQPQGPLTAPLRQGLDWLSRKTGRPADVLARIMTAVLGDVYAYLTRPPVRRQVRDVVAAAIAEHRPTIVLAHSLGSVVAYEVLHALGTPVDLLVTLGSPLGLGGSVFTGLDPAPIDGAGARPPGVGRWVNIADPGDLVAVPRRLGDRFPVDRHDEAYLGVVDFHTMGGYLACGLTAAAVAPYSGF